MPQTLFATHNVPRLSLTIITNLLSKDNTLQQSPCTSKQRPKIRTNKMDRIMYIK